MSAQPVEILTAAGIPFRQVAGRNGTELLLESCPACHRKAKCQVNAASGAWHCFHAECGAKGSVHDLAARLGVPNVGRMVEVGGKPRVDPIVFDWKASHARAIADPDVMAYLRERGLDSVPALERLRIGMNTVGGEKFIAIPHFTAGRLVGVKLRRADSCAHEDRYRSILGSTWSVFNGDALARHKWAIIAEGELNALAWIVAGIENAVSLGSANKTAPTPEEIIALERLDYVVLNYDRDKAGLACEKELVKRLGAERCRILHFDSELDAKDANEVLVKHGAETLRECSTTAKRCEVPGVMGVTDALRALIDQEAARAKAATDTQALAVPWPKVAEIVTLDAGRLVVLVGHPKTGKTTAAVQIAAENGSRGIPTICWCLEMPPTEIVRKIVCQHFQRPMRQVPAEHYEFFLEHWQDKPLYLGYGALRTPEEAYATLKTAVRVYGARLLVLDNLHYLVRTVENQHAVLANAMKYLKELVVETGVCLVLIAQPGMSDTTKQLGLYAARGSAAIASDCDTLIAIEREGAAGDDVKDGLAKAARYSGPETGQVPTLLRVVANRYGPPGSAILRYIAGEERFVGE